MEKGWFFQLDIKKKQKRKEKERNLDTDLTHFTKINSKWIRDLNVKHKTMTLLENNIGEKVGNLRFGDDFLAITPKAQSMKKTGKLEFINIKNFSSAKNAVKRIKT